MFKDATSFNQDINMKSVTVGGVTYTAWDLWLNLNARYMFEGANSFNGDITDWWSGYEWQRGFPACTDLQGMFEGATVFNQDIGNWCTVGVENMSYMFKNATSFNQDLPFVDAAVQTNHSIWTTASVETMAGMFEGATAFNGDIRNWDTDKVTDMSYMFKNATSFNQDISQGTYMIGGFTHDSWLLNHHLYGCTSVKQMFFGASAFDQDISNWDVSSVTDHDDFDTDTLLSWTAAEKPSF